MTQLDRIEKDVKTLIELAGNPVNAINIEAELYDEHGVSFETSKYGGVRLKSVDELLERYLSSTDPQKIKVAREHPKYVCCLRPNTPLSQEIKDQIYTNQQNAWAVGWLGSEIYISDFYELLGTWEHRVTKERAFKRPNNYFDPDYKNWIKANKTIVRIIPDHFTASYSNLSSPDNPNFYSDFLNQIHVAVEKQLLANIVKLSNPTKKG